MTQPKTLSRGGHASHAGRCLIGLPSSQVEADPSRIAVIFYCMGTLDILASWDSQSKEHDRESWRDWLWEQQISGPYGAGFRPSPFITPEDFKGEPLDYETGHLVMTYTALLCLSMLRDDFSKLDRPGLLRLLRSCQQEDGSFTAVPNGGESDLRMTYCAFVISSLLNDWSGMDLDLALAYIHKCYSYEGGYGQAPFGEAVGGTTYCAIASLHLAPDTPQSPRASRLAGAERARTVRWLVQNQCDSGGFSGRTNKLADACYCFWCGTALTILGHGDLVNEHALADFLANCQFKFGGLAKAPGERPDPYHTYLSLAILAILPSDHGGDETWKVARIDPLWNATESTAQWARKHIPAR